jgi:competence protein ComGC
MSHQKSIARHRLPVRRGFAGILMLLVVMLIILMLYFMSAGSGGSYAKQVATTRKRGQEMARDISTQQLLALIVDYKLNHDDKLPTSVADLEAGNAFNDQWGRPMTFSFQKNTRSGAITVTFHSDGPDGEPNTADDINKSELLPG